MDYQDFTINVRSREPGSFEAEVVDAPLNDSPRVEFCDPIERTTLEVLAETLDQPSAGKPAPEYKELGRQLYEAVFCGDLAELFVKCQARLPNGVSGLRIRLRFRLDDPEARYLASLPWELLWSEEDKFLAVDRSTPIVREIQSAKPFESLAVEPPLRILIVDAVQKGTEIDRMAEALDDLQDQKLVELLCLEEPGLDPLRDVLLDEKIHVLHFMGHGGFDPESGFGAVFFLDSEGKRQQVGGARLATYLDDIPDLRLVVLNSCLSACYAGAPLHTGVAATLLEQTTIPAVVANQYSITHSAATEVSKTFYGRIASGDGVDSAITEARLRSQLSQEWATPVLFLGARDGNLFSVQPVKRRPKVRVVRSLRSGDPVRLGIRSFDGWGQDMDRRTDDVLDLVSLFEGRTIRRQESWNEEILPRLEEFLRSHIDERRPLLLDFAAHSSIAFAAGWVLDAKSGLDVRVRQRTQAGGEIEWRPKEGSVPDGPLWQGEPDVELDGQAPDIALALAVSQPEVAAHVQTYIQNSALPVSRILRATIAPQPGPVSVAGGAHALRLAQDLLPAVRQRRPHERDGRVHIFAAAPNALTFYLGQLSRSFGEIVLYEHPFGQKDAWGQYQPSIELGG